MSNAETPKTPVEEMIAKYRELRETFRSLDRDRQKEAIILIAESGMDDPRPEIKKLATNIATELSEIHFALYGRDH